MYLSFNSKVMNASQITDYLDRVVQPQASNHRRRRQRADARRPDLRHAHLARPRPHGLAQRHAARCRAALAANNFTSAPGQVKGDFVQTDIDAKTSLDDAAAFGQLVVMGRGDTLVRLSDVAEIELGPQSADSSSVFDGLKAVFIGIYATPDRQPADGHHRCAQGVAGDPEGTAAGPRGRHRL